MEYRRLFDTIPEQFDRFRPRYSAELFADLTACAKIGPDSTVLEIGPGTGQATDPILQTGCGYHAIELGAHLCETMKRKYARQPNFHIVNDDFITHDFGTQRFDLVYSAASIQWIPEETAFSKTFELLKPGGTLAMILTSEDYRTHDEALYRRIQEVYAAYFRPETEYRNMHAPFDYANAVKYGYIDFEKREFYGTRVLNAEDYVSYRGTDCTSLVIPEPYRSRFFSGLRQAVLEAGDRIVFRDTYLLYLAKKPERVGPDGQKEAN